MPTDREADDLSTVLQARYDPSPLPEASFALRVVKGPEAGRSFSVDGTGALRLLLGQSPVCEFRLSDREVSRRHVALELDGAALRLTDLGSKNGTFVDGLRVGDAWLRGGETVCVGSTTLRVERLATVGRPELAEATRFGRLVGASREMRRLYPLCERLAASDVPVIIEGETGTGKEVLAEALHEQGRRASGPFLVFDCTAVSPNLVESELFGHARGAFTGAVSARKGLFEQADGGTLLIDELGDLDLALQPKLLRVVERAEVRRVGGDAPVHVDVRLIAATRRDLDGEVQAGRFRDDLFHRLAVGRIELPPLRRRRGDVPLLVDHFVKQLGGNIRAVPPSVLAQWEHDAWPGNVRELRNAVARVIALGDLPTLQASAEGEAWPTPSDDFIERVLGLGLPLMGARAQVVEHFERRYLDRVLAEHDGNVVRAAAASGIARRHFDRLRVKTRR
jgi:DNA-binding NtrC family response regulator